MVTSLPETVRPHLPLQMTPLLIQSKRASQEAELFHRTALSPPPKHTPQPYRGLPDLSLCCPLRETPLLGPEAESLVFWSASCMGRGVSQRRGRVLAAWCNTWSSCTPQTSRELRVPGVSSARARGAKAEPHPPAQTQRTRLSMEGGAGAQDQGAEALSTFSPQHTHPFLSRGVAPAPHGGARAVPVSRQSLVPSHPPFPGCTWDLTATMDLPGNLLPLPQGSS